MAAARRRRRGTKAPRTALYPAIRATPNVTAMCQPPVPRSRPQRSRHADRLIAMMTALRLGQPPPLPQGPPQPLLPRTPPRQQRLPRRLTPQQSRQRRRGLRESSFQRKYPALRDFRGHGARSTRLPLLTMMTTTQPPGQRHAAQAAVRRRTLNRLLGAPRPRTHIRRRLRQRRSVSISPSSILPQTRSLSEISTMRK